MKIYEKLLKTVRDEELSFRSGKLGNRDLGEFNGVTITVDTINLEVHSLVKETTR